MIWSVALLLVGLVVLTAGGELLVRGAAALAVAARVSSLVIGLTVVAMGTSAPELAVSLQAALAGQTDLAIGNVVGSNIFNILVILGISALITPLMVTSQLVRIDVPLMIAASVLVLVLGLDGRLGRVDGMILAALLVLYVTWTVWQSRRVGRDAFAEEIEAELPRGRQSILVQLLLIAGGLILLGLGARWLVGGAVTIARHFGVSELVIGLTIVAAGTSLPEVAASILATVRGEREIAVGNAVGSNLFNLLGVLGLTAALGPAGIAIAPEMLRLDLPLMIAVAVVLLPILYTGDRIARWEGGLFVGYYLLYTVYLVLGATGSPWEDQFVLVVAVVVLPLTAVMLLISLVRMLRS